MEDKLRALLKGLRVPDLSNEPIENILARDEQYFEELGQGYIDELDEAYEKLEGISDILIGDHECSEECIPSNGMIH